eukprot:4957176-Amphidinium_carterae.1
MCTEILQDYNTLDRPFLSSLPLDAMYPCLLLRDVAQPGSRRGVVHCPSVRSSSQCPGRNICGSPPDS